MTFRHLSIYSIGFEQNSTGFDAKALLQTLESGFHQINFDPSKRFAVNDKRNNRLVQGQMNMFPNLFPVVFLLHAVFRFHGLEQHFFFNPRCTLP